MKNVRQEKKRSMRKVQKIWDIKQCETKYETIKMNMKDVKKDEKNMKGVYKYEKWYKNMRCSMNNVKNVIYIYNSLSYKK